MFKKFKSVIKVENNDGHVKLFTDRLLFDNSEDTSVIHSVLGQSEFIASLSDFVDMDNVDADILIPVTVALANMPELSQVKEIKSTENLKHLIYSKGLEEEGKEFFFAASLTKDEEDVFVDEVLLQDFVAQNNVDESSIMIIYNLEKEEISIYLFTKK